MISNLFGIQFGIIIFIKTIYMKRLVKLLCAKNKHYKIVKSIDSVFFKYMLAKRLVPNIDDITLLLIYTQDNSSVSD